MRKLQVKDVKHWQGGAILLLGAWFVASPWLLDLERSAAVLSSSLALGLALLVLAAGSLAAPRKWERWAEFAVGLGIAASPWLAGYADDPLAWRNAVGTGLICALLALWLMVPAGWSWRRSVLRGTEEMAH